MDRLAQVDLHYTDKAACAGHFPGIHDFVMRLCRWPIVLDLVWLQYCVHVTTITLFPLTANILRLFVSSLAGIHCLIQYVCDGVFEVQSLGDDLVTLDGDLITQETPAGTHMTAVYDNHTYEAVLVEISGTIAVVSIKNMRSICSYLL